MQVTYQVLLEEAGERAPAVYEVEHSNKVCIDHPERVYPIGFNQTD